MLIQLMYLYLKNINFAIQLIFRTFKMISRPKIQVIVDILAYLLALIKFRGYTVQSYTFIDICLSTGVGVCTGSFRGV